ncbi:hypothetical protein CEP51_004727 [Fusarium floridanum]|uniref:Major facilitator superfamily (MFS) profile domain-containing protein n=1 Tax=Fusarium floridanum TaxID=1325733 RepID=A0A428RZW8_9HYPO|nr:hypothetical protein CEP51_004727 [Fusarium floridanum]
MPPPPNSPQGSLKDTKLGDSPALDQVTSIDEASITPEGSTQKRRYYGLAIICLLNLVLTWAWLSYAMVNTYAQEWFEVGPQSINWFSTVYGLAFIPFPLSGWFIHRYGLRTSIIAGSIVTVVGSWVRYAGTAKVSFAGAMVGQTLLGVAQIFIVPIPSAYSEMWFHPHHRTTPTTVGSISPSLGSMIGSLATPYLAKKASGLPRSILIVAIISTVVAFGALFVPGKPSAVQATQPEVSENLSRTHSPKDYLLMMIKSPEFYMVAVPFIVGLAIFNCWASLLLLYLVPYGFPVEDAGLLTGLQTGIGMIVSLVVAPIVDKWRAHISTLKVLTVIQVALYVTFVFVPPSRSRGFAFAVAVLMGVAGTTSLSLSLETLAEILYPVPPEFTSTACWCIGNVLGAVWLFAFAAGMNENGDPPGEMSKTLYAQAALAAVCLGVPINLLGLFGRKDKTRFRRRELNIREHGEGSLA